MRRGFCNTNENANHGEACNASNLADFSEYLDSSFISEQKREYIRLVSDQVEELRKKSVGSFRNRIGSLGKGSKSVRIKSATSRPGFCQDDVCGLRPPKVCSSYGQQPGDTSSEPRTDCDTGRVCNVRSGSACRVSSMRIAACSTPRTKNNPCSVKFDSCSPDPDPYQEDQCPPDPCLSRRRVTNTPMRPRSSPRNIIDECSQVANQMTSGLPPCPLRGPRSRHKCLLPWILSLLLLLLLLALTYFFLSRGGDSADSDCSARSSVRYVPY